MMEDFFFPPLFSAFWETSVCFFPSGSLRLFSLPQEYYLEFLHIGICSVFLHDQGVWLPGDCIPIYPYLIPSIFPRFLSSVLCIPDTEIVVAVALRQDRWTALWTGTSGLGQATEDTGGRCCTYKYSDDSFLHFLGRSKLEITCMSYLIGTHSCDTDTTKCFRFQFYSDSDQKRKRKE